VAPRGLHAAAAFNTHWKEQNMKIVVLGGTGLIGSKLVNKLHDMGHDAVAASPASGVNAITGEGLHEVLEGARAVVDVTNSPSFEEKAAMEFFTTSTRNLLAAEQTAGVSHHVALCIVGTDRLQESAYFRAKLAQENLIKQSKVPYTILRSTQFFEFVGRIATASADGKSVRAATAYIQPIVSDDVVAALAETAVEEPVNGTVEIAGPDRFRIDELIRRFMKATGDAREVVSDAGTRYFGALLPEWALTSDSPNLFGSMHFADWLAYSVGGAQLPMSRPTAAATAQPAR
jgi:uncharacterized protein YbjT (DUF2867 family)